MLDKAINPYRDDIAAIKLKEMVAAPKYVEPKTYQIICPIASVKEAPNPDAEQASQALMGEFFEVYEINNGYAWGQLVNDEYVGYIDINCLGNDIFTPTHKIKMPATFGFESPKVQAMVKYNLPMGAYIRPLELVEKNFIDCGNIGFIYQNHLIPIDEFASNPSLLAKQFLNVPYLWGGKTSYGIDCSGLVQIAFGACGIKLPRDARMQETCGQAIEFDDSLSALKCNDLIFWKGHVGIMLDEENMIHANAYHMMVAIEPLKSAANRILENNIPIRSIRRII